MLTPARDTDHEVLNLALELVALCRAVPVVMDADAHDRAVALVSHTPQLVSSMVAARLEEADETAVRLCGQGIRDVTRIAASDPRMWVEILSANPGPVADVLAGIAADLEETVEALRGLQSGDEAKRRGGAAGIEDVLRRGNMRPGPGPGQARRGAHGVRDGRGVHQRPPRRAGTDLRGQPSRAGVNIEDVRIEHATGQQAGLVQLMVEPRAVAALEAELRERGWALRQQ